MTWALQQAVYNKLTADASLMAAVNGVYEYVPQADDSEQPAAFPYITIGGSDTSEAWDTDDSTGQDTDIQVDVWARGRSQKGLKLIQAMVYNALHRQELSIAGHRFINCAYEFSDSVREPDGLTIHGVQRFRVLYEDL